MRRSRTASAAVRAVTLATASLVALPAPAAGTEYVKDGRKTVAELVERYDTLATAHDWQTDTIYRYPGADGATIRAWRTRSEGPALWVISGLHGEEPAGPNAIAQEIESIADFAIAGVPVVLLPLSNPEAYRRNWRYPNTAERDWRKGGYSVGDAESLLPDLETGKQPRAERAPGPETEAYTRYVLELARRYPPLLVVDLHEDELSTGGGYVYSQGVRADDNPVVAEVTRLLRESAIPIRRDGRTRFGEPIVDGVVSRDDRGGPIRDGSIDELLSAREVFVDGRRLPGPSAPTVIVVETPAYAGSRLGSRVDAHAAVVRSLQKLWDLNRQALEATPQ
jgi:hypothetical protein